MKEVELNEENVHLWNWFIRVRIDVEVSRPLKPGIFLPRRGLKDLWIGLKYEKLPDLCLKCGIMGHESRFCGCQPSTLSNEHGFRFLAFGPWMRTENDLSPLGIYQTASWSTDENFQLPESNIEEPGPSTTN